MTPSFKVQVDRYFRELEKPGPRGNPLCPLDRLRSTDRVTFAWSPSSTHLDKACMIIVFRITSGKYPCVVIEDVKAKCLDRMDLLEVFMKSLKDFAARRGLGVKVVKSPTRV
jgi:hypothetical protein